MPRRRGDARRTIAETAGVQVVAAVRKRRYAAGYGAAMPRSTSQHPGGG